MRKPPASRAGSGHGAIAQAALLMALGNGLSRALGLARELLIAHYFGASGLVSVLRVALTAPTLIYDLLFVEVGNAALVPVFSAESAPERRAALGRAVGAVLTTAAVGLGAAVLLLEIFAPQWVRLLGGGYDAALQQMAASLVRWVLPAAGLLGLASIGMAVMTALRRFRYPALAPVVFNGLVVAGTAALAERFGVTSVMFGVLAGALGHLLLHAWGLRGLGVRWSLDWRHPALRQAARLSGPVLAGLATRGAQIILERNLASHTGAQSLAWMENALTLHRLPLALAVTALSVALLPSLARLGGAGHDPWGNDTRAYSAGGCGALPPAESAAFRDTLGAGLRWALLIGLPAAVVLWVLAPQMVRLLFEHGRFTATDTYWTTAALRLYLIGLPFAAIDQPLVVAFYARQNTLTPVLAGVVSVAAYAGLAPLLAGRWGMRGLAAAASVQIVLHAVLMLIWTKRRLDAVDGPKLLREAARIGAAAALAGAAAWLVLGALESVIPAGAVWREAGLALLPSAAAGAVYGAAVWAQRMKNEG